MGLTPGLPMWRARTRAGHLNWASTLGTRALPTRLSAHDPVVRLAGAACAQRHPQKRRLIILRGFCHHAARDANRADRRQYAYHSSGSPVSHCYGQTIAGPGPPCAGVGRNGQAGPEVWDLLACATPAEFVYLGGLPAQRSRVVAYFNLGTGFRGGHARAPRSGGAPEARLAAASGDGRQTPAERRGIRAGLQSASSPPSDSDRRPARR